tara:strand:- start:2151 stop:2924 length:774 start_codon:yes stop_codon:yes gene_type:complete
LIPSLYSEQKHSLAYLEVKKYTKLFKNHLTMSDVLKRDQTCESWLNDVKKRPRPRKLLEYFAQNIAKHNKTNKATTSTNSENDTASSTQNSSNEKDDTSTTDTSTALNHLLMYCRHCTNTGVEGTARAFYADPPPQLIFCTKRVRSANQMEDCFVHEMIHAVDHCTRDMNLRKCDALACSEIRAAREAECLNSYIPEWKGEKIKVPWAITYMGFTKEGCVRDNATRATQALFPGKVGAACVNKMFDQCFKDTVPFDE